MAKKILYDGEFAGIVGTPTIGTYQNGQIMYVGDVIEVTSEDLSITWIIIDNWAGFGKLLCEPKNGKILTINAKWNCKLITSCDKLSIGQFKYYPYIRILDSYSKEYR